MYGMLSTDTVRNESQDSGVGLANKSWPTFEIIIL